MHLLILKAKEGGPYSIIGCRVLYNTCSVQWVNREDLGVSKFKT